VLRAYKPIHVCISKSRAIYILIDTTRGLIKILSRAVFFKRGLGRNFAHTYTSESGS
jgi:hypothetical protein